MKVSAKRCIPLTCSAISKSRSGRDAVDLVEGEDRPAPARAEPLDDLRGPRRWRRARRRSAGPRYPHPRRRPTPPRPWRDRAGGAARTAPACRRRRVAKSPSMAMPRMRARVVCALWVTIETLAPTIRFSSVDLPALGSPISAMNPARVMPRRASPAAPPPPSARHGASSPPWPIRARRPQAAPPR